LACTEEDTDNAKTGIKYSSSVDSGYILFAFLYQHYFLNYLFTIHYITFYYCHFTVKMMYWRRHTGHKDRRHTWHKDSYKILIRRFRLHFDSLWLSALALLSESYVCFWSL
jgi:hypothetical protein